ncbi:hypothetical protein FisN_22Lu266 [Fistulifera solaris]|uniref:Protein kish n=1 Tax=Fistulifera solaris TaxID=1519565 RepID=A0A1Z5JCC7_FISSO|nr:hypothetical protein FisN_22Lu266 [Fistulifera solaris]|eukprot:GAX11542.1 hypothetical protein FisN_22Lu266 [Fistulifera solaris]
MSAIFNFSSLLTVLLLLICTCAYLRELRPGIFDPPRKEGETKLKREGLTGFLWKMSRIGERLSPYIGVGCFIMAIHVLFIQ